MLCRPQKQKIIVGGGIVLCYLVYLFDERAGTVTVCKILVFLRPCSEHVLVLNGNTVRSHKDGHGALLTCAPCDIGYLVNTRYLNTAFGKPLIIGLVVYERSEGIYALAPSLFFYRRLKLLRRSFDTEAKACVFSYYNVHVFFSFLAFFGSKPSPSLHIRSNISAVILAYSPLSSLLNPRLSNGIISPIIT